MTDRLAGRSSRLAAWLLDSFLNFLCLMAGAAVSVATEGEEESTMLFLGWAAFHVPLWIYQAYLRATRGQTIGKKALRIRIVDSEDDSNPGFWRAVFLRDLVPFFITWAVCSPFGIVNVAFIFGPERRCVHDYMARTIVVRADVLLGVDAAEVFD